MTIKKQKGSFLLEFLISLGIFSIALTGLVKLQNRSIANLSNLGSDMAIPILIADFTDRINLSEDAFLPSTSRAELEATATAFMKTITVEKNAIEIRDMNDLNKKTAKYSVVLDASRSKKL